MIANKDRKKWEKRGEKSFSFFTRRPLLSIFLAVIILGCLGLGLKVVVLPLWFAGRTVDVVKKELDPQELLRKYEWFKDASAQLDKKIADINVYQAKVSKYEKMENLDRTSREQLMTWDQELAGIKASFNSLAAEYNSNMKKINWRFCNAGDLPEGATEVLPKEFKPYQYK